MVNLNINELNNNNINNYSNEFKITKAYNFIISNLIFFEEILIENEKKFNEFNIKIDNQIKTMMLIRK